MLRRFIALVAALLCVVGLLGASPASAAVPVRPTGLSPNGTSVAENPTLTWTRVTGATSYDVEVSASSAFTTTLYTVNTVNRRATPTSQLPGGQVWWRVRAQNSSGAGAWSAAGFTRSSKAGPTLVSPAHEAVLNQPGQPPLLQWQPVRGATGYTVEIDGAEGDWVDTKTYPTKTSSLVVPNPQENGTYWWRVRALLGSGLSTLPSQERSYTVGPLPVVGPTDLATPDPDTQPLEGASVQDVVFDWSPVPGAISYELRVSTDNSFSNVIDQRTVYGTRYSPTETYDVDDYWWQIRAKNIFGKAQEWTDVRVRTFRRQWTPVPQLLYPADSVNPAVGDDLYFQWTPVQLASRYRFDIGNDPNFSPGKFKSCFVTQTTFTPRFAKSPDNEACAPISAGATYYWRVKALDGPSSPEINSIYSAIRKFIYDPGQVTLSGPANGATVDVPTLTWQPIQGAEKYLVTLKYGTTTTTATTYSTSWTPTGTKPLDRTKGPFSWTVQGIDRDGLKTTISLGPWRTFNLSASQQSGGAAPTPLSPTPGEASVRFPNLTWAPVTGAAYYQVYVGTAGSSFFKPLTSTATSTTAMSFPYPAATDLTSTYLAPGDYDWFVRPYSSTGVQLTDGPGSTFTIADLQTVTNRRVALTGQGLDSAGTACTLGLPDICHQLTATPVLDWDPVPSAAYYLIYLSRDKTFQNMVYGSLSDSSRLPSTSNTRWTPTETLPDSQAGVAYYWFVRPCKATGYCAPDPVVASNAFDKTSNQVQPMTVVSASQNTEPTPFDLDADPVKVQNDVRFDWTDYLQSDQSDRLKDPLTGEHPDQAARGYHLQVGTTAAFSTIVDDVTVDQTTYTAFNKTYPEGDLFWRIQAVDGTGYGLAWSPAMEFVKESKATTLVSPVDATRASSTQPFRWNPLPFAASYDIEVYKNNDTAASSINRVLSANSKQVAYTMTTPLPAADVPYAWRIRRVDASARKGAWSGWGSFRVGGTPPAPASPASGTYVIGNDALFTWTPVAEAAWYKFERRQVGATSVAESIATVNSAWATPKLIANGAWEWRGGPGAGPRATRGA